MWRQLRLRGRILLSYGVILLSMLAFTLYVLFQLSAIRDQTQTLQSQLSATVILNTQLTSNILTLRQSIAEYLRDPSAGQESRVRQAIGLIGDHIRLARGNPPAGLDRQQLTDLRPLLATYEQQFQALVSLSNHQRDDLLAIRQSLVQIGDLNDHVRDSLADSASADTREALDQVEHSLRTASVWSIGLDQSGEQAGSRQAASDLRVASLLLTHLAGSVSDRAMQGDLATLRSSIDQTAIALDSYATNITLQQSYEDQLRATDTRLSDASTQLQKTSDGFLASATKRLSDQSWRAQQLVVIAMLLSLLIAIMLALWLSQTITRPLRQVVQGIERMRTDAASVSIAISDRSEIGQLASSFSAMAAALADERVAVERQQQAMAERNHELEQALAAVQQASEERDALAATVRSASVPVVPILEGVVLLPLVGEIDSARALALTEQLLRGVESHRARLIVLDVTGVPLIDSAVAQWLIRAIDAARLLGARCVMVGMTPEVAQTLVASGIDLGSVETQADLRTAIAGVIQRGRRMAPAALQLA